LSGKESLTQNFEESSLCDINNGNSILVCSVESAGLFGEQCPDLIEVDDREMKTISLKSEGSDTFLSEVTRMITIHGSSVVGETTGITSTT
jgi:hypothetical protein